MHTCAETRDEWRTRASADAAGGDTRARMRPIGRCLRSCLRVSRCGFLGWVFDERHPTATCLVLACRSNRVDTPALTRGAKCQLRAYGAQRKRKRNARNAARQMRAREIESARERNSRDRRLRKSDNLRLQVNLRHSCERQRTP